MIEAKRDRRRAERKWKSKPLVVFHDIWKKAKHVVSRLVEKAKAMHYNREISQAKSSKELFKITDGLMARKTPKILPSLYQISDLPSIFSDFFHDKIATLRTYLDSQIVVTPSPHTYSYTSSSFGAFQLVTEATVRECILKSPPKTCELDSIPTPLLLECLDSVLPSITALINSSLTTGIFPEAFKKALVSPLLKKATLDPNELKNYRPVSNLSFVSKITEKLVLSQLSAYLISNDLYETSQSAYRLGHSTETALLKVVNDLLLSIDDRNVSILTLLDLSAAFDTIDHATLLQRLEHVFGVHDLALQWFSSYLSGRTQSINVDGHVSSPKSIQFGVPQGSVLGPVLFVLYTSPLSAVIKKHSMLHHSYADDTNLQKSSPPSEIPHLIQSVEECLKDVKTWMTVNKLKLNDDKTEVMLLCSTKMSGKIKQPTSMTIGNSVVPFSSSVKSLGVTLDNHLDMKLQVQNIVRAANYELRRISSIRRYLTTEATATLVSAFVLSRIDYCNSLLYGIPGYLLDSLQRIQNNAARMVLRIPRSEHITPHLVSLHWLPISARIEYKIASLCYNSMQDTAPKYLREMAPKKGKTHSHNTRLSKDTSVIRDSSANSQPTLGDRCFTHAAPAVWNTLPIPIRESSSVTSFKTSLKTHLFRSAY